MSTFVTTAVLGILLSIIGIVNMTGNVLSLHWYHRQRVSPQNMKSFGRLVGLGTILMGVSMIIFGIFSFLSEQASTALYTTIGTVELILGIAIGLGLNFYAMIKYNRGIF